MFRGAFLRPFICQSLTYSRHPFAQNLTYTCHVASTSAKMFKHFLLLPSSFPQCQGHHLPLTFHFFANTTLVVGYSCHRLELPPPSLLLLACLRPRLCLFILHLSIMFLDHVGLIFLVDLLTCACMGWLHVLDGDVGNSQGWLGN